MAKRTGPSKTKAFRQTDISQVEENLEQVRVEKQISGGAIIEKSNDELFQIDRKGSERLQKMSKTAHIKPLRLDEIVKPKSKIDVPPQRIHPKVEKMLLKKKLQSLKVASSKRSKGLKNEKIASKAQIGDLWINESFSKQVQATPKGLLQQTEVRVKPVRIPAPGASYNPDPAAHETLINKAAEQELARLAKQQKINTALDVRLASKPESINYEESTGMLYEDILNPEETGGEEESELEGKENCYEFAPLSKLPSKKKTKADKRKEAEEKVQRLAKLQEETERRLDNQALHAKTLAKRVRQEQAENTAKQAERAAALKQKRSRREGRKIGPMRFVQPMISVQLPEEVTGSLRTLKPEGNLLEDRFKALQEQAKIEPRVRRALKKRKFELRSYEKHSYKNFK